MIKKIIAGFLLTASTLLAAEGIQYTWDTPAEREDGSALPISEIGGYTIKHKHESEEDWTAYYVEGTENIFILEDVKAGINAAMIATVDSDGQEGAFSDAVISNVVPVEVPSPAAPTFNKVSVSILCEPLPCALEVR